MQTITGHCPSCGAPIEFEVEVRGVSIECRYGQNYASPDLHIPRVEHWCPDPHHDRLVPLDDRYAS